jgi:hypothetical protein
MEMIANLAKQTSQIQIPKKNNWSHGWQQKETDRTYDDRMYVYTVILRVQ